MTIEARLAALAAALPPIASLFDAEPQRLSSLSLAVAGVHFDFAKLSASADVLAALHDLAMAADLACWSDRLFAGAKKNLTKIDLMTIEAEEIHASRVFLEGQVDLDGDELVEEKSAAVAKVS